MQGKENSMREASLIPKFKWGEILAVLKSREVLLLTSINARFHHTFIMYKKPELKEH